MQGVTPMPNATVRANARTLPIDRRAAIGAIAAAGAVLAAPRAAEAASPDAELFALRGPIDVADGILCDAYDALALAEKREMANRPVKPTAPPMDLDSASRQTIEEFGLRMAAILEASSAEDIAYDEAMRQWEEARLADERKAALTPLRRRRMRRWKPL